MYVEERMYRLKIGAVPEYLKNYQESGMAVQLSTCRTWWATTSPRSAA